MADEAAVPVASSVYGERKGEVSEIYVLLQASLGRENKGWTRQQWVFRREAALEFAESIVNAVKQVDKDELRDDVKMIRMQIGSLMRRDRGRFFGL